MLSLYTNRVLPVEERLKRKQIRAALKNQAPENVLKEYPMLYNRNRKLLGLGMLDYNLTHSMYQGGSFSNYTLTGGVELLGGDFQGTYSGFRTNDASNAAFSNLRWRYVFAGGLDNRGNPLISEVSLGQVNMGGPTAGRIRGIALGNTPLVPRRVLDLFVIEGNTIPDSEIELLIGGQLVDFVRADEVGYYRFTTPLTFGTIRIGIRIYTPQGEVINEDRQLQIPFTFVPRGMFNYNLQAGYREIRIDSVSDVLSIHGDVSYGLTNNVTLRVGAGSGADSLSASYFPYGSINMRVFDQILLNLEAQPDKFARSAGSVFFANNTAATIQYTEYLGVSQLNPDGQQKELVMNYGMV